MNYRPIRPLAVLLCAAALLIPGISALADDPIAEVILKSDSVIFQPRVEVESLVLTINSPCGIVIRKEYDGRDTPTFDLEELEVQNVDGTYKYRLEQTPFLSGAEQELIQDLRKNGDANDVARSQTDGLLPKAAPDQTGYFVVSRGAIITDTGLPEEGKAGSVEGVGNDLEGLDFAGSGGLQGLPQPDILHNDDVIIFRSLCVGFDCVNGEVFNADTIRLKENNLRIHFEDTSVAAGFPTTDWRLIANDQANGGASYFSIQDASANRRVFTVEANAPSNSLYVDNGGRIGIRTSNPVVDLHISDGDTPTLRLEQTGASGFAPQTWDVAGNETSFFIRDATNGSTLPFRIRPTASSNSLVIDTDDDVGVGVLSPEERLHVVGTDNPRVLIEDTNDNANDKPGFVLRSPAAASGADWAFEVNNNGNFQIDFDGNGGSGPEMIFTDNTAANSAVTINGDLTVNGVFSNPSSKTLKTSFEPVDLSRVLEQFVSLPIQRWSYIADQTGRRHIGPFTEDFQETFGLGTMGTNIIPLDVQGVTIAAVQGLHQKFQQKSEELEARNTALAARVAELEAMIERLTAEN